MTTSNTTLASLWVDDVHRSPLKSPQTTPSKNGVEINNEFAKYYKDSGLGSIAQEAGLLNANGDLIGTASQPRGAMIALSLAGSPASQPMILPKSSSPMILGTPQRVFHLTSPQTPGVSYGSPTTIQTLPLNIQRKRNSDIFGDEIFAESKRMKKGEKGGKGLRHFSMKVCEKVQRKGTTSYNEVADELVTEFSDPRNMTAADQQYDQKNIRRRVYDALNVLMAMNIISKEKKEIKWIGLPTNSAQECQNLELEKEKRLERIRHKTQQLQELILQQIAFKNLVRRNRELERSQGPPSSNSAIQLPFIIVNTNKKTVIDCSISNDKYEYLFNFNNTFEIHDDIEVLKRMGMAFGLEKNKCGVEDLKKAVRMVPKSLEQYVHEMASTSTGKMLGGPSSSRASAAAGSANSFLGMMSSSGSIQSPLALPLTSTSQHHDSTDIEVAVATGYNISRQSSVGSFSAHSRAATETPSENFSESESERSSPVADIMS